MKTYLLLLFFFITGSVFCDTTQFSQKSIQLAWFYKPPPADKLSLLAQRFSWFVLTNNDESIRDDLKQKGAKGPFLQYLRFDAIQDPGSCNAAPKHNQVATERGDFCRIAKDHPDWILRDNAGNPIEQGGYVYMDPGNSGWQQFWLERAQQMQQQEHWDGLFLDNVEASLVKRHQKGMPAKYTNEQNYEAAIADFLAFIYGTYSKPNNRPLMANIISLKDPSVWFRYLQYLDGAMVEAFAVDWHTSYKKVEDWNQQLNLAEQAQDRGKMLILVAQGDENDQERQQFAFASYLLVTRGRSAFRYADSAHYAQPWMYQNYDLEIGNALGPRFKKADGTWERDFEKAIVRVNPVTHQSQIILKQ